MSVCVGGGQLFFEADDSLRQMTFVDQYVCVCVWGGGGAVIL